MEKSYVSLEQKVCAVCGQAFDSGSILFDNRLENSMEHKTVTGWGMCQECQKKEDDGYIALVEIDPAASSDHSLSGVFRTGRITHIKIDAYNRIFSEPFENTKKHPNMAFVEPEVTEHLLSMMPTKKEE